MGEGAKIPAPEQSGQPPHERESGERLRFPNERLEMVLEGVADGITVQDRSGRLLFANTAAARLCGFESVDALLQAPTASILARFEILDEQGRPFANDDLPGRKVLSGDQDSASALIHVRERATGKHWWTLIRSSAVLGPDGAPDLAVNIWHDVTAEQREQRDRRYMAQAVVALGSSTDTAELLRAFAQVLVPSLADWCSIYLLEGDALRNVVSLHADAAKSALAEEYQRRFPPDPSKPGIWNVVRSGAVELYNDIPDELLAKATDDPEQLAILRAVGMTAVIIVPITLQSKVTGVLSLVSAEGGRRYDESHLALLRDLGERAGIAIERASLYRAAQAAAKAAEDASRAKDEFLATVSHELRTPLNAMLGWATILKDRVEDPAIAKPIQAIFRNAQAQVKIIEDILDVSRVITGKFKIDPVPVDIVKVARDAAEVIRPSATAKSVRLELDVEDHCTIVADAERLQQVIWNLLSNAVRFTPNGGAIVLAVHRVDSDVWVRVADTGAGIDPAFLPYVFDRFRQGDPSPTRRVGGLGLGLALVRHIVELHGGHVEVESRGLGKGATFSISLPIRALSTRSERPLAPAAAAPSATRSLAGRLLLVLDDDEDTREVIAAVLEDAGASVEKARSVGEALMILERTHPAVILSDIAMPGEDGYAFIRKLRANAEYATVPVLALTAYARDEDRRAALDAGFQAHLGKPTNPAALLAKVDELLAWRSSRADLRAT